MKTVKIPSDYNPYIVVVNGVTYAYKAGTTQEVPDEVAAVIENYNKLSPKENPTDGGVLPFVTREDDGKLLGVDEGAWGKVNPPESGTEVVANPTLAGTEPALTGLQVGDDKFAVGGMSQADADARYLQLSGGTMTGDITFTSHSIKAGNNEVFNAGNGSSSQPALGNTSINANLLLRTKAGKSIVHQTNDGNYAILDTSMGLPVLTTAPSADNTDGLKIVVLNSEPATKYNGYLYIITA